MKKQHRIVSLLLVIILLSGAFLFASNADSKASGDGDFQPTATYTKAAEKSSPANWSNILFNSAQLTGKISHSGSYANQQSWLDLYSATNADSDNPYLVVSANQTCTPTNVNPYIQVNTTATEFSIAPGTSAYYVVDIDLGTYSELIPEIDIHCMNRQTSSGGGFPFSTQLQIGQFINSDEAWTHLTLVGDIATDTLYVFANGELVYDDGYTYTHNGTGSGGTNGQSILYHMGFRLEFRIGGLKSEIKSGDSVLVDDPIVRFYKNSTEAGNLKSAVASGSLANWNMNYNGRGGEKLPAVANIDGTNYCNEREVSAALSFGTAEKYVSLLRESISPINIGCCAHVTTNGITNYNLVNGATKFDNGNGTFTTTSTDIPEFISITNSVSTNDLYTVVKSSYPDNGFSGIASNKWNVDGGRTAHVYENTVTGDKYAYTTNYAQNADNSNSFINLSTNFSNKKFTLAANEYFMIDIDVAADTYELTDKTYDQAWLNPITQTDAGRGAGVDAKAMLSKAGIPEGDFAHFTFVGSTATNTLYLFINGQLVNTQANYLGIDMSTSYYLTALRVGQSRRSSFYFDNVVMRMVYDNSMANAIAAGQLKFSDSNIYDESYDMPQKTVIARANGKYYGSSQEIAELLKTNAKISIEFFTAPASPIPLKCNATIYTNGFDIDELILMDSACTATKNGNIVNISCPFVECYSDTQFFEGRLDGDNASVTERFNIGDEFVSSIRYLASDNQLSGVNFYGYNLPGRRGVYIRQDNMNGEKYAYEAPYDGTISPLESDDNYPQWGTQGTGAAIDTPYSTGVGQHILLDFDIASFDHSVSANFAFITRSPDASDNNRQGANINVNAALNTAGISEGSFAHVTIVGMIDTNTAYIFVNGKLINTITNGVTSTPSVQSGFYLDTVRYCQRESASFCYDNVYIRVVTDSTITNYINNKSLVGYANNVYTESYQGPKGPALATVNGVIYYNESDLMKALFDCEKAEVEFHRESSEPIIVGCDATIDTHGLAVGISAANGGTVKKSGNIYTVHASNIAERLATSEEALNAVKYNHKDNILASVNYGGNGYNKPGFRASYLVRNRDNGDIFLHDTGYNASVGISHLNWQPTGAHIDYVFGQSQYIVADLDVAMDSIDTLYITFISRGSDASRTGYFGTGKLNLASLLSDYAPEEFAHVTLVASVDNQTLYCFVNGTLKTTVSDILSNQIDDVSGVFFEGIRIEQSQANGIYYDNFCLRNVKDATLTNAILAGSLATWTSNIYTSSYKMTEMPRIATVDGVSYNSVSALSAALTGGSYKTVEFHRTPYTPVTFNCDGVVDTNGCIKESLLAPANGASFLKDEKDRVYLAGNSDTTATVEQVSAPTIDTLKANITGNIITNVREANARSLNYYLMSNRGSSNSYYALRPAFTGSTGGTNTYLSLTIPHSTITSGSYYIFDMDIATETLLSPSFYVEICNRPYDANGNIQSIFGNSSTYFSGFLNVTGEWAHVTLIGDYSAGLQYVFVNGNLVGTVDVNGGLTNNGWIESATNGGYTYKNNEIRISLASNNNVDQTHTMYIDNVSMKFYSSSDNTSAIASYISNKSLLGYECESREGEKLPAIANIDGTDYYSLTEASLALSNTSKEHVVYILRDTIVDGGLKLASNAEVAHHGFTYTAADGYAVRQNVSGCADTVYLNTSMGDVKIVINGTVIYENTLPVGVSLSDILAELGSYGDKVVVGNGHIFTDVSWSTDAPDKVTGDYEYVGTGTKYTGLFYAHKDGTKVSYTDTDAGFKTLVSGGTECTIIFNGNIVTATQVSLGANKTIYLNGYELTFAGADHAFSIGVNAYNLSIIGPGTVSNQEPTSTHAFAFVSQGYKGKITLKNLTLNAAQAVLQLRDGNALIENCTINSYYAAGAQPLFMIGGSGSAGQTMYPIQVDIVNSTIIYRHYGASIGSIFQTTNLTTDISRTVNVIDSTIISQDAILNCYSNNSTIRFDNSVLIGSQLCNNSNGTIIFVDNVSVNDAIANHSTISAALKNSDSSLRAARSNNNIAPVTYTSNYATVVWAGGITQYWIDGSVPVASNSLTKVTTVYSGRTYHFDSVYESVPFALKGNLTLESGICFNLYVKYGSRVNTVIVNSKKIEKSFTNIDGVLYERYAIELTPTEAAGTFDVIFILDDGNIVVRPLSVTKYAQTIYQMNDDLAKTLMSNALYYIKQSAAYFGVAVNTEQIDTFLSEHPITNFSVPTSSTSESPLSAYISGVQLNIMESLKFRFNLKNGQTITSFKIVVNGQEKEIDYYGGYVEVALSAYEMSLPITIKINGVSDTYELAKYINTANALAQNSAVAYNMYKAFCNTYDLDNAIYSYCVAAYKYKQSLK